MTTVSQAYTRTQNTDTTQNVNNVPPTATYAVRDTNPIDDVEDTGGTQFQDIGSTSVSLMTSAQLTQICQALATGPKLTNEQITSAIQKGTNLPNGTTAANFSSMLFQLLHLSEMYPSQYQQTLQSLPREFAVQMNQSVNDLKRHMGEMGYRYQVSGGQFNVVDANMRSVSAKQVLLGSFDGVLVNPAANQSPIDKVLADLKNASDGENSAGDLKSVINDLLGTDPSAALSKLETLAKTIPGSKFIQLVDYMLQAGTGQDNPFKDTIAQLLEKYPEIASRFPAQVIQDKLLPLLKDKPLVLAKLLTINPILNDASLKAKVVEAFQDALAGLKGQVIDGKTQAGLAALLTDPKQGAVIRDMILNSHPTGDRNSPTWQILYYQAKGDIKPEQAKLMLGLNSSLTTDDLKNSMDVFSIFQGDPTSKISILEQLAGKFALNSPLSQGNQTTALQAFEKATLPLYDVYLKDKEAFDKLCQNFPAEIQSAIKDVMGKLEASGLKVTTTDGKLAFDGENASGKVQDAWATVLLDKVPAAPGSMTLTIVAKEINQIRTGSDGDKEQKMKDLLKKYTDQNMPVSMVTALNKLFESKSFDPSKITHEDLAKILNDKSISGPIFPESKEVKHNDKTYKSADFTTALVNIQKALASGKLEDIKPSDMEVILAFSKEDPQKVKDALNNILDIAKSFGKLTDKQYNTIKDGWSKGIDEFSQMSTNDAINKYAMDRFMLPNSLLLLHKEGEPFPAKQIAGGLGLKELSDLFNKGMKTQSDNTRGEMAKGVEWLLNRMKEVAASNGLDNESKVRDAFSAMTKDWDKGLNDEGNSEKFGLTKLMTEKTRENKHGQDEPLITRVIGDGWGQNAWNETINAMHW